MATLPGIPSLYAGDEVGIEGVTGEDGRRPFPWHNPAAWDQDMLLAWQTLFAARSDLPALRTGGLRWVDVNEDSIVFLRELPDQRILVQASRAPAEATRLPARHFGGGQTLSGIAGTADLAPDADLLALPDNGPAIRLWLVP